MEKASSFFFCLPSTKKSNTNLAFSKMHEFDTETTNMDKSNIDRISNLHYPETGNIEYSEYSDEKFFKNDLFAKDYKDGILLVSNQKFSGNNLPSVAFELNKLDTNISDNGRTLLRIYGTNESFGNLGQINWKDKKFDKQVTLYFVFPNFSKNKLCCLFRSSFDNDFDIVYSKNFGKIYKNQILFLFFLFFLFF